MNRKRQGFTLIELLIVVAVIGVMLPVMFSLMLDPMKSYAVETAREAIQADCDKVMRSMGRDIRGAARVVENMDELHTSPELLILEVPRISTETDKIELTRVVYRYVGDAKKESNAPRLTRQEYRQTEEGWREVGLYPLSREVNRVRFSGDEENWAECQQVMIDLDWKTAAAHTSLVVEATQHYTLRGAVK